MKNQLIETVYIREGVATSNFETGLKDLNVINYEKKQIFNNFWGIQYTINCRSKKEYNKVYELFCRVFNVK